MRKVTFWKRCLHFTYKLNIQKESLQRWLFIKSKKHRQRKYQKASLETLTEVTCIGVATVTQQAKFVTLHKHMHNMLLTHLKYIIIEEHHYDTGDVER